MQKTEKLSRINSILNLNEIAVKPGIILHCFPDRYGSLVTNFNFGVVDIRVLCRRVITPNDNTRHSVGRHLYL